MSTSTSPPSVDEQALAAMLDHHARLCRELDDRVIALRSAVSGSAPHGQPQAALSAFLADSVSPHAAAEEATLYRAASGDDTTALLVQAMIAEHRALTERIQAVSQAGTAVEALAAAEGAAAIFAVHVEKENDLLLPALQRAPGVSLAGLLEDMHRWLSEHQDDSGKPRGQVKDPQVELDVRALPHGGGRHEAIFARLEPLAEGERLVIVNDHDPRPLHYQIDAAWRDTFGWEYLQSGPEVWRVAITRGQR